MKRILNFFRRFRRSPRILDLPREFGPWLTLPEVKAALKDEGAGKLAVTAMVQVIWRYRGASDEAARSAGARGETKAALYHLGAMDLVNDVLADLKSLREVDESEEGELDALRKEIEQKEAVEG